VHHYVSALSRELHEVSEGIRRYMTMMYNLTMCRSNDEFQFYLSSRDYGIIELRLDRYGRKWFAKNHPKARYHLSLPSLRGLKDNPFLPPETGRIQSGDPGLDAQLPEDAKKLVPAILKPTQKSQAKQPLQSDECDLTLLPYLLTHYDIFLSSCLEPSMPNTKAFEALTR